MYNAAKITIKASKISLLPLCLLLILSITSFSFMLRWTISSSGPSNVLKYRNKSVKYTFWIIRFVPVYRTYCLQSLSSIAADATAQSPPILFLS